MKSIKIKAIFKGQHGSCGYKTDKKYTLTFHLRYGQCISIERSPSQGYCEYESVISFLANWDNIYKVKEREPLFITEDGVKIFEGDEYWYLSKELDTIYYMDSAKDWFLSEDTKRFSTYQAARDWIASQKPKSLKPEELVDGEIYTDSTAQTCSPRIFRFKEQLNMRGKFYSQIDSLGEFSIPTCYRFDYSTLHPAVLSEKLTLIRAEIIQEYFHELKNQK